MGTQHRQIISNDWSGNKSHILYVLTYHIIENVLIHSSWFRISKISVKFTDNFLVVFVSTLYHEQCTDKSELTLVSGSLRARSHIILKA